MRSEFSSCLASLIIPPSLGTNSCVRFIPSAALGTGSEPLVRLGHRLKETDKSLTKLN
jgi:hypothetical protein